MTYKVTSESKPQGTLASVWCQKEGISIICSYWAHNSGCEHWIPTHPIFTYFFCNQKKIGLKGDKLKQFVLDSGWTEGLHQCKRYTIWTGPPTPKTYRSCSTIETCATKLLGHSFCVDFIINCRFTTLQLMIQQSAGNYPPQHLVTTL